MGIPKFFRYVSERYPLTSQLIQGDKIPEFDNFYLDFNGIIHNCSHPNDADAHFRLSEEQIFTSIFAYVDHIYSKIRPKKLFFMAVDGVAPRAKMNQQRSRRFRTAREAREVREKAERAGERLPDEKAFDSNCITPGTPFMARLSEQLQYFVNKKISEDSNWHDVQVILSGHSVPGEGEHKIMEYIRLSRAQEDYNPNIRHCLYGLDADLIMLGLLSHDPHFCLLREEVKFGPAAKKKTTQSLETQSFFLLHISLLREYLDLEFRSVQSQLSFPYDLERVIDDFVLLSVFVGNDFLPHLPDFHIHDNALERLFEIYKNMLPKMGGYLNTSGVIDMEKLQLIMDALSLLERDTFIKENADINWYKGKQAKYNGTTMQETRQSQAALSEVQSAVFHKVQQFVLSGSGGHQQKSDTLTIPNTFAAREREFIKRLASELNLSLTWDEYDENDENVVAFRFPGHIQEYENESKDEPEASAAVTRVLKKYSEMTIMSDDLEDFDSREETRFMQKIDEWKRSYYREKLGIRYDNPEELDRLVFRYAEGLQWVMHYYYSGVASWGWFYDYHYAPRISELRGLAQLYFQFDLGEPFTPFQQLMGVLPEASKDQIPLAYQDLMYAANSPILDFYPSQFEQDLNGKKQEWEAVVKIPFIDEVRLLRAMQAREHQLTPEERRRNEFGTSTLFLYDAASDATYPSSLPGFFPDIHHCLCVMEPFYLPTLDGLHLVPGLLDGVSLGVAALAGFPSLSTLQHRAELAHHGVNVFQSDSRNKSIVVYLTNLRHQKAAEVALELIGKRTFIGWPFLKESMVVAVSDSLFRYESSSSLSGAVPIGEQSIITTPHSPQYVTTWQRKAQRIEETYSKRFGVVIGTVDIMLHVRPLKGLKRVDSGALMKDYENADKEIEQALQVTVSDVISEDLRFQEKEAPLLSEEFPIGSKVFFLGEHAYGVAAQVTATTNTRLSVVLAFFPFETTENAQFTELVSNRTEGVYFPSFKCSHMIGISGMALAKITSSLMVIGCDGQKTNVGLNLKFEAKSLKVIDYSRKDGRTWEYSERALHLLQEYKSMHPEIFRILERRSDVMIHANDIYQTSDPDKNVKEVKFWLKQKGVPDFEPVSLFSDHLKKETIAEIEQLAEQLSQSKTPSNIKKAVVQEIPRQAVLQPAHASYKLQNQHFALGDRVVMVQDTGSVPLSAKGVVVGLASNSMEVVWDVAFMSGTTLGSRCSPYRGLTVSFDSCLNLTNPQYVMSTTPNNVNRGRHIPSRPPLGPRPAVESPASRNVNGNSRLNRAPMQILANPRRPTHRNGLSYDRAVKGPQQESEKETSSRIEHLDNLRNALNVERAPGTVNGSNHVQRRGSPPSIAPSARGRSPVRGRGRYTSPQTIPISRNDLDLGRSSGHIFRRGTRDRGRGRGTL